jgi:hypothetical protein
MKIKKIKMKKTLYITCFALLSLVVSAQKTNDIWRQFETFRIPLKEKVNLPLRKLPGELIRAYCEGSIKAYYPMDTTKEVGYHEFVAHFDMGVCQPEGNTTGDEFTKVPCPQAFCASNDEYTIEKFLVYFELLQVKRFDKNKSMEIIDVKYVRLKYTYMKGDLEVILDGPVFKYSDIAALAVNYPDLYKVPNPKNTAEDHTIKKVLDMRMFNGIVLEKHKPFDHPSNEKDKNPEKDRWHH